MKKINTKKFKNLLINADIIKKHAPKQARTFLKVLLQKTKEKNPKLHIAIKRSIVASKKAAKQGLSKIIKNFIHKLRKANSKTLHESINLFEDEINYFELDDDLPTKINKSEIEELYAPFKILAYQHLKIRDMLSIAGEFADALASAILASVYTMFVTPIIRLFIPKNIFLKTTILGKAPKKVTAEEKEEYEKKFNKSIAGKLAASFNLTHDATVYIFRAIEASLILVITNLFATIGHIMSKDTNTTDYTIIMNTILTMVNLKSVMPSAGILITSLLLAGLNFKLVNKKAYNKLIAISTILSIIAAPLVYFVFYKYRGKVLKANESWGSSEFKGMIKQIKNLLGVDVTAVFSD